jgi:hypothetical protein
VADKERLAMAKKRKPSIRKGKPGTPEGKTKKGIYRPTPPGVNPSDEEQRVAEFSYQNDALAELIVNVWTAQWADPNYDLDKFDAKKEMGNRGIHLENPVVISEKTYYGGYTSGDTTEVVFVLPDRERVQKQSAGSLLEAAKLLMACTPNGI